VNELIVDNFAGGGGASEGIEEALGRPVDFAINHDREAIAMHRVNHPGTHHLCSNVWEVDPVRLAAGRRVGLGWFSPDCTFYSRARGGKPFRDRDMARRRRGLPHLVPRWCSTPAAPRVFMLENVVEMIDWCPLLPNGRIDPKRRGMYFRRWHSHIERIVHHHTRMPYRIDMRELAACDYDAPTTRKRLFVIGRADGQEIVFPERMNGPGRAPYRTAAECIDWSDLGTSIFERPRDLAENTLRRIARGIVRHVINDPQPFIVGIDNKSNGDRDAWSGADPLRTITTENRFAVVTPMVATMRGTEPSHIDASARRVDEPLRTISAAGTHHAAVHALLAPFLANTRNGERAGQHPRVRSLLQPHPTVTAIGSQGALVTALLAKNYGGHENDGTPMVRPMDTITARDHHSLVTAMLLKYYGTDQNPRLREPLGTITTRDRFALVTVHGAPYYFADIRFRMLRPRELYLANSFRRDYIIDHGLDEHGQFLQFTQEAQTRMCGNSVPPKVAKALVLANYIEQRQQVAA
jgi:DNA (cytosine-5)-methyltransferase 1